jgi:signal transduction histidine kinase
MGMTRTERGMERIVSDTGHGMKAEKLHRVLDPFSAAAVPGMPESPSLGLHIVTRLVELHGGELAAESRVGEGTTFASRFPRPRTQAWRPRRRHRDSRIRW